MASPQNGNPSTTAISLPDPSFSNASNLSLATRGIHADDPMNSYTDVAPALHVSTTFRYTNDPDKLIPEHDTNISDKFPMGGPINGDAHIYSRLTAPNTSRLEILLSSLLEAPTLTYTSGLAAFHALLVHLHPKVVAIGAGYHGCHGVLKLYQKLTNCKIVDIFDEKSWDNTEEGWSLGKGDVVHLETPVNPTGKAYSIRHFADLAHQKGAVLTIDATFAPPPLQDPWKFGADFVMHSGTKYIGGHSDMLCGVLAVGKRRENWEKDYWGLFGERVYLGSVMGSMEGWLGVRSLRTYELRVKRQSESADRLVQFLARCLKGGDGEGAYAVKNSLDNIEHASLQEEDMVWLKEQMPNGFGPVFSVTAKSAEIAKRLPSKLHLFHHATSLGGVESLIEWRSMSDDSVEPTLLRLSIGVENWEDLKADLLQGFQALLKEGSV